MKKLLLLFLILTVFACRDKRLTEAQRIVNEWVGKEIRIPDNVLCTIMGKDTASDACRALLDAEYKVLLYVDSTGCSSCRLKLFQWETLMSESDSLFRGNVSFLFFFQPKSKKELNVLFRREKFNHPVFIDMKNAVNRLNHFPANPEYQCFLLDKDNKVQMVGNPTLFPKLWTLYRQVISGQAQERAVPVTDVSVSSTEIKLTDLQKGKKSMAVFTLKNTGNQPLLVSSVNVSCGCTKLSWERSPVAPGKETSVTLEIQPEETGFFHKTVQVHCNTEKGVIPLVISGEVREEEISDEARL